MNFKENWIKIYKIWKKSKLISIKTDKSRNIYKIESSEYSKILHKKITETYKIDNNDTINHIINDTRLADKLKIKDKLGKRNSKNAYSLFKDHKWNFINKKQTRLINPTKRNQD